MKSRARILWWTLLPCACAAPPGPAVALGELVPWVELQAFAVKAQAGRCERVGTARAWARLRDEVDAAALPQASGDFAAADCVLVVLDSALGPRRFVAEVATEEGVDVLILSALAVPPPNLPGVSMAALLRLPRRGRQLAVVLRLGSAHEGQGERTLAVFPPDD